MELVDLLMEKTPTDAYDPNRLVGLLLLFDEEQFSLHLMRYLLGKFPHCARIISPWFDDCGNAVQGEGEDLYYKLYGNLPLHCSCYFYGDENNNDQDDAFEFILNAYPEGLFSQGFYNARKNGKRLNLLPLTILKENKNCTVWARSLLEKRMRELLFGFLDGQLPECVCGYVVEFLA